MNSASFHCEARKARCDKCPAWLGEVWPAEKYSCSLTCHTTYQNDTEPHVCHSLSWSVHQTVYYTCQDVRMYPCWSMSLVRCPRTKHLTFDIVERLNVFSGTTNICSIHKTIHNVLNGTIELNNWNYIFVLYLVVCSRADTTSNVLMADLTKT